MEKRVRVFRSFEEVDRAENEYYRSLTPEQRIEMINQLRAQAHPHAIEQRLERVYRVIKLGES